MDSKSKQLNELMNSGNYTRFVLETGSENVEKFFKSITLEDVRLMWAVAGLVSEAGEVQEVIEKAIRKKGCIEAVDRKMIYDELGDTLYWVQQTLNCVTGGVSITDLSHDNMEKLYDRVKAKEDVA